MYSIRPIQPKDNPQIAEIIREVSIEFGLAAESGFAVGDSILDSLYQVYQQPNAEDLIGTQKHNGHVSLLYFLNYGENLRFIKTGQKR